MFENSILNLTRMNLSGLVCFAFIDEFQHAKSRSQYLHLRTKLLLAIWDWFETQDRQSLLVVMRPGKEYPIADSPELRRLRFSFLFHITMSKSVEQNPQTHKMLLAPHGLRRIKTGYRDSGSALLPLLKFLPKKTAPKKHLNAEDLQ